jgi:hypothetical protein
MKGAGALKAHAQRMSQIGAVAGDHRGQHDGIVLGKSQGRGQAAHGRGQSQKAATGCVLQSAYPAEEGGGGLAQALHAVDADGGRRGNALVEQEIFAVPDARIAVDLWPQQPDHGAQALATVKGLLNGQTDAAGDWLLRILGVGDYFQCGDVQVNPLRWLLLCVGRVQVLLLLTAQRTGINDRALHSAQQAIGKPGQRGSGSRMRLHLRAPSPQQQPHHGQRQPGDPLRAQSRQAAEHGQRHERHQHQAGPQIESKSLRGGDSNGKKDGCGKKRNSRLRGLHARGWGRDGLIEVGGA